MVRIVANLVELFGFEIKGINSILVFFGVLISHFKIQNDRVNEWNRSVQVQY